MTATYSEIYSNVRPLRPGDDGFMLQDNLTLIPRAMIAIHKECPGHVRDIINTALQKGWAVPVAHIYEHEQTFNLLSDKA